MRSLVLFLALLAGAVSAVAALKTEALTYEYGGTTFHGYLAYDDARGAGKRPGVLVIHEWYGLNDYARQRADQLAQLGYVVFAPDVFGGGKLAASPDEARELVKPLYADRALLRNRLNAALDMLARRDDVDAERVAAIGYCFGGMAALELARSGARLAGVVSFHGSLGTPNPARAGDIHARILVEHGGSDPNVKADEVAAFMEEMQTAKVNWQMDVYGTAVHGFTNPGNTGDPASGVAYHPEADEKSWAAMQRFFGEILQQP